MDAVIFIAVAMVFVLLQERKDGEPREDVSFKAEDIGRKAKLNETFYEDAEAFYEIAHALGFPKEL